MFEQTVKGIYQYFSQPTWTVNNIPIMPQSFESDNSTTSWIRLSILWSNDAVNRDSNSGRLQFEIFTPRSEGELLPLQLCDKLKLLIGNKIHEVQGGTHLQIFQPWMGSTVHDKGNTQLNKTTLFFDFKCNKGT